MTTLREKRHRQCLNTIGRLTEQRELAFRRLAIISDKLKGERLRLNRLQKELGKQPMPKFTPLPKAPAWIPPEPELAPTVPKDWLARNVTAEAFRDAPPPLPTLYPDPIPAFLKRDRADAKAKAEIEAHKAEVKGTKTKARIDRLKAAQRGDLKKMPPSGKDAMKLIREGGKRPFPLI